MSIVNSDGDVGLPEWEVEQLNYLSQQGLLSGAPPYALEGMLVNESGYGEIAGAGVNTSGYGGYFGLPTSVEGGYTMLNTAGQASFITQAEEVGELLKSYASQAGVLGDVAIFNIGGQGSDQGEDWSASTDAEYASQLQSYAPNITGTGTVGASLGGGTFITDDSTGWTGASTPAVDTAAISGTPVTAQGTTISGSAAGDPFTNLMKELEGLMTPSLSGGILAALDPDSYLKLIIAFLLRGGLALGFFAVGAVGLIKLATGGKVGASDIPGIAAGFMAGPEAGLMNLMGRMGAGGAVSASRFSQRRELSQGAQAIQRERTALSARRTDISERRQAISETYTPQREARAERRELRQQVAQDVRIGGEGERVARRQEHGQQRWRALGLRERTVRIQESRENRARQREGNPPLTEDEVA